MIQENFIKLYEHSFRENWDLPCYTDYGENESYTYGEVAQEIAKLHLLFKHCSLRRGDKIAVIGKNNARWCIAYMAVITYGGIVVPLHQRCHLGASGRRTAYRLARSILSQRFPLPVSA